MINIENKFMTIGVKENISLDIQLFMWNEIEERILNKKDYAKQSRRDFRRYFGRPVYF